MKFNKIKIAITDESEVAPVVPGTNDQMDIPTEIHTPRSETHLDTYYLDMPPPSPEIYGEVAPLSPGSTGYPNSPDSMRSSLSSDILSSEEEDTSSGPGSGSSTETGFDKENIDPNVI